MKLLSLIGDMLDVQMLEMGKMKFKKNNFKISELFENLKNNYENLFDEKKVQLIFPNNNSISLTSDKKRIEQVLSNLINNSLEFISKENGIIEVSANEDNKSVIFSVKDNGKGIPKEYQKQIFQKFYQIDTSERRVHEGAGLGLSISKGIVDGLGGNIWIKNGGDPGCNLLFSIPKGNLN
jgi:signal transduction histidine kinase